MQFLRDATADLPNCRIDAFENQYLVDYAGSAEAAFILRGVRSGTDFGYEWAMRHVNSDLNADITTAILIPPRDIAELSSSLVKGLVGPEGWQKVVRQFVPQPVFEAQKQHHELSST